MTNVLKLQNYALKRFKTEGSVRTGTQWSAHLCLGHLNVADVREAGDGSALRWTWNQELNHDDFRSALAQWVQVVIPGSTLDEYMEPEAAFVQACICKESLIGANTVADLEFRRQKPKAMRAPNWETLKNRLEILLHAMKLGHSSLSSLQAPCGAIVASQFTAIKRIETWIQEGLVDVDNWQVLDDRLGGLQPQIWASRDVESAPTGLQLVFGCFVEASQWDKLTAEPITLTVLHQKPIFEVELTRQERN